MSKPPVVPVEIHNLIAEHLEYASDVNSWSRTCRAFHGPANQYLYTHFSKDCSPNRIIGQKNVDALRKLLPILHDDWEMDEKRFFEGSGKALQLDAATKLVATIRIFTDLHEQGPAFHEINKSEFAEAVKVPEDLKVFDVLSKATSWSSTGDAALWAAAEKGSLGCVNFLLEVGRNVDAADKAGQTALMRAAEGGHLQIVKRLHQAGADINFMTRPDIFMDFRRTPLFNAAMGGHEAVVRCLRMELISEPPGISIPVKWVDYVGRRMLYQW